MKVTKDQATLRDAGALMLRNYLTADSGASISVASAQLNGSHPESISLRSDRCYIFVEGSAQFTIDDSIFEISKDDVVYVPKGTRHSISGEGQYWVINNPPFVPE